MNDSFKNRGMFLENIINDSNTYYNSNDKCLIYKKPTPIKILHLDYSTNKITNAFFETQSTLDYNGVYKGYYIEFDAKECHNKTSFPLSNISSAIFNASYAFSSCNAFTKFKMCASATRPVTLSTSSSVTLSTLYILT